MEVRKAVNETIDKLSFKMSADEESRGIFDYVKQILKDKGIEEIFNILQIDRSLWVNLINAIFIRKSVAGFFILPDEGIAVWIDNNSDYVKMSEWLATTHLFVNLTEIIFDFISEEKKKKFVIVLNLLSTTELEILDHVRAGDFTELIIKRVERGNKSSLDIIKRTRKEYSKALEKELIRTFKLESFETITLKRQKGEDLYIQRERRIALD